MSVLIAVAIVGAGSLVFRLAPLLGARRIPDRLTVLAGWAALSVLVAMTVRSVLDHQDPTVPGAAWWRPVRWLWDSCWPSTAVRRCSRWRPAGRRTSSCPRPSSRWPEDRPGTHYWRTG